MSRKILFTSIIATLFFLCSSNSLNAKDKHLMMEVEDHNLCLSKVASVGQKEINNQTYWKCRIHTIKNQMFKHPIRNKEKKFNKKKNEIIKNLQFRVDMAKNENYAKLELTKEAYDHKTCLKRGFSSISQVEDEIFEYYECRIKVEQERVSQAPFSATSYEKEKISSIERSVQTYMKKRWLQLKAFNFCSKYLKSQITFGNCVKTYASYERCLTNMPSNIIKRQQDDLVFCKEQSVKQFPDEMAIYTDEADYSGPKFSKTDTIELRNEFNKRCLETREKEISEYTMNLPNICETKLNSWK